MHVLVDIKIMPCWHVDCQGIVCWSMMWGSHNLIPHIYIWEHLPILCHQKVCVKRRVSDVCDAKMGTKIGDCAIIHGDGKKKPPKVLSRIVWEELSWHKWMRWIVIVTCQQPAALQTLEWWHLLAVVGASFITDDYQASNFVSNYFLWNWLAQFYFWDKFLA